MKEDAALKRVLSKITDGRTEEWIKNWRKCAILWYFEGKNVEILAWINEEGQVSIWLHEENIDKWKNTQIFNERSISSSAQLNKNRPTLSLLLTFFTSLPLFLSLFFSAFRFLSLLGFYSPSSVALVYFLYSLRDFQLFLHYPAFSLFLLQFIFHCPTEWYCISSSLSLLPSCSHRL